MKRMLLAAALAAVPFAAQAHPDHGAHAEPAAAPASRLNLDTPVEAIVADAAGKAVLDKHLPGMVAHPQYEQAKAMSLRQISGFAPEHITAEVLAKVEADLAAIK